MGVYRPWEKSERHFEVKRFQRLRRRVCLFLSEDVKTGKVWVLMITEINNLSVH